MPNLFQEQLEAIAGALPKHPHTSLPLTHMTDWAGFLSIVRDGELIAAKVCPIYGDHLIYSFYGRPAYRLKSNGLAHNTPSFAPVCFLLNSKLMKKAKRMLPFDSGGFDLYGPAMHPSLTKETFEMPGLDSSVADVMNLFWGGNGSYVRHSPKTLAIDPAMETLLHYYLLISNKLSQVFDERCSTIEIQVPSPVPLIGSVVAVVAPSSVSDDHTVSVCKKLDADFLPYEFDMPYYVQDFHVSVRSAVRDYLEAKGLV